MPRDVALVVPHDRWQDEEFDALWETLHPTSSLRPRVVSSSLAPACGVRGGSVTPDALLSALDPAPLAALVFVGGPGAVEWVFDHAAHDLARAVHTRGGVVAAICNASSVLAEAGLLQGLEATSYPDRAAHLRARGATWCDTPVVRADRVLTGRDPAASAPFAQTLLEALTP